MSLRSFHATFVQHLGRPPGVELHRLRIEKAKRLLLEGNDKLEFIADMCGFQSLNSFWVAFKRATSQTPTQFRKQTDRPAKG
jgi:LacI family transcriptional regulator